MIFHVFSPVYDLEILISGEFQLKVRWIAWIGPLRGQPDARDSKGDGAKLQASDQRAAGSE
jgi:hypothetical protein